MPLRNKSSRWQKVMWLLAHQPVWEGFPSYQHDSEDVFYAMQAAGLYSKHTVWTHADIHGLVSWARKFRREHQ